MESEKINVPSSEKDSANISAEKEKDTEETSLNSSKVNSPSSITSLGKTHDKGEESTEKEPLSKSKIDDTEPRISKHQTNISESEKINVPSSETDLFFFL